MQFQTAQAAREFVLAGNAIVTFKSNKTGKHYTCDFYHDNSDDEPALKTKLELKCTIV